MLIFRDAGNGDGHQNGELLGAEQMGDHLGAAQDTSSTGSRMVSVRCLPTEDG